MLTISHLFPGLQSSLYCILLPLLLPCAVMPVEESTLDRFYMKTTNKIAWTGKTEILAVQMATLRHPILQYRSHSLHEVLTFQGHTQQKAK